MKTEIVKCPRCYADMRIITALVGTDDAKYFNRCKNPKCGATAQKHRKRKLRLAVLVKLGGVCAWCKYSDVRALQIDHVPGHGATERRTLTPVAILRRALSDTKDEYQILCANCNWIKGAQHEEEVENRPRPIENKEDSDNPDC